MESRKSSLNSFKIKDFSDFKSKRVSMENDFLSSLNAEIKPAIINLKSLAKDSSTLNENYKLKFPKNSISNILKGDFKVKGKNTMKNIINQSENENFNKKFEMKNIFGMYNVFKKEENHEYRSDYINKVFKLLHKKNDKNYFIKKKMFTSNSYKFNDNQTTARTNLFTSIANVSENLDGSSIRKNTEFRPMLNTNTQNDLVLKNPVDAEFSYTESDFNDSFFKNQKKKLFLDNDFILPNNKKKIQLHPLEPFNTSNSHNFYVKNQLKSNTTKAVKIQDFNSKSNTIGEEIKKTTQSLKNLTIKLNPNKKYVFGNVINTKNTELKTISNFNSIVKDKFSNESHQKNYLINGSSISQSINHSIANTKLSFFKSCNFKSRNNDHERAIRILSELANSKF